MNRISRLEKILNRGGNPYHDEKGRFTFSPEGVGSRFYKSSDNSYYSRGDKSTTIGFYDIDHDGYLVVKERKKQRFDEELKVNEDAVKKNFEKLSKEEISSLADYTNQHSGINYSQVNKYMRTGEGTEDVKSAAKNISSALNKSEIGSNGVVYRGIDASVIGGKKLETQIKKLKTAVKRGNIKDATKILQSVDELNGKTFTDKAPMSTNAYYKPTYGQRDVILMINVDKNTKGLDISSISSYGRGEKDAWTEKFGSAVNSESEVLLAPNTTLKFDKVTLDDSGVIINCSIESQHNNLRLERLNTILNGGPGSGNHNPGQGQGVGKPAGGQVKHKFTKDSTKEELSNVTMKLINEFLLKKEKILDGAKDPQAIKEGIVDKNSIPATKKQLDEIDKLDKETTKRIRELQSEYYKAKGNYTKPGYYKGAQGNVYEIVEEWGKEDYSNDEEFQKMFPVDAPRTRENTFFIYKNQKLEKASDLDIVKSIKEGMTLRGINKQEERVIKSYTYATPQNAELRKGTNIDEIPSAKILKGVIDRTKSERGTFYRGFRTKEGAKDLLNLKVGDTYQDKGFMSTDRTEDIAKNFSASKILLEIENNKNKFGTNLSVSSYSMHPEESEVLFNAGTKMKIKEISEKDGFITYRVEVI